VKGLPGSAELRKQLHAVMSLDEVAGIFADYLENRDRFESSDKVTPAADDLETVAA
jgi:hypothetical protein